MASLLSALKGEVHKAYTSTVASLTPALTQSRFVQEGVLTPDEFVAAGDLLVYKCPTWAWAAGDATRAVPYLPADKQFLITRNVPCGARFVGHGEGLGTEDDDWLLTPGMVDGDGEVPDMDVADAASSVGGDDDDDDGDIPDMDDFDEADNVVDPAALPAEGDGKADVVRARSYDIALTYDKYYLTPRVWLFGYSESQQPLSATEMFMDISADHAHKTVTLEKHPHLGVPYATIHPCRHATVMKKFVSRMLAQGKAPRVDQYLLLFLKFLGAVIPTIQYDNTFEIGL